MRRKHTHIINGKKQKPAPVTKEEKKLIAQICRSLPPLRYWKFVEENVTEEEAAQYGSDTIKVAEPATVTALEHYENVMKVYEKATSDWQRENAIKYYKNEMFRNYLRYVAKFPNLYHMRSEEVFNETRTIEAGRQFMQEYMIFLVGKVMLNV